MNHVGIGAPRDLSHGCVQQLPLFPLNADFSSFYRNDDRRFGAHPWDVRRLGGDEPESGGHVDVLRRPFAQLGRRPSVGDDYVPGSERGRGEGFVPPPLQLLDQRTPVGVADQDEPRYG